MKRHWAAAGTAAGTSLLFVVLYNAANHLTGLRPDTGIWAFDWERHWPVVPVMIVPYWSIDLLFFVAPFLAGTAEEVALLRRRIVAAILGATAGFLLIPLQFAFPRPVVEGMFGPWFGALHGFDLPHNLFPSLHIALRTLLAEFYVGRSRGSWRWVGHGWFSLIGVSTLLTWQHHLVDVVGGFWLAAIVLHLFPAGVAGGPHGANRFVAGLYALGAITCSQLARIAWPWTFVFIWPAFACGAAACAYAGHGRLFAKSGGRITGSTRWLLAPLLAGQWISWRWYCRAARPWSELTPTVRLGRVLTVPEARRAVETGVTAVLDLTGEFDEAGPLRAANYRNIAVLDLTAPSAAQLEEAVAFVEHESRCGIVFIHCKVGYSRTAAVAAAWLRATGRARDVEAAFARLREVRPGIVIRPEIRAVLGASR